jgi:hypothetical protein
MSLSVTDTSKFAITRTGLDIQQDLSFEEWRSLAPKFSAAIKCAAFVIGDWLVYGEDHFRGQQRLPGFESEDLAPGRISGNLYDAALAATGLDRTTLQSYAYVARCVPRSLRNEHLSWEHHKAVAKLEEDEQERWLKVALDNPNQNGPVSTRRLRKSIIVGRLLTPEELHPDPLDRGIENHIPYVNRLVAWWNGMKENRWLAKATKEQRAALKRDLAPLVAIYQQL